MNITTLSVAAFEQHLKQHSIVRELYNTPAGFLVIYSTIMGVFKTEFMPGIALDESLPIRRSLPETLVLVGTDFQINVWRAALKIPHGTLVSYSQLATNMGRAKAHRAVATALAQNKITYFIPCHRIVGSDGALRGYAWGIDKKLQLITAEAIGV